MNNKEFDRLLKARVENINIPFEPAHWALMEEKLNQHENTSRATLYFIKGVETLLLIVTVWALLLYGDRNTALPTISQRENPKTTQKVYEISAATNLEKNTTTAATADTRSNPAIKQPQPRPSMELIPINQPIPRPSIPPSLEEQETTPREETPPPMAEVIPPPNLGQQSISTNSYLIKNQSLIETISTLPIQNIPTPTPLPTIVSDINLPVLNGGDNPFGEIPRLRRWGVRLNGSFDYNADTRTSNAKSYLLTGFGEATGLVAVYNASSNISIESGFRIAHRAVGVSEYDRDVLLETNRDRFLVLGTNSLLAEVPLNARYTFGKNNKTRFFVSFGASAFAILKSKYFWRNRTTTEYSILNSLVKDESLALNADITAKENPQKLGLFWTSNVGLGISQQLSKRAILFIQPNYQQGINGNGDNFEKINTLSILLGTEIKF